MIRWFGRAALLSLALGLPASPLRAEPASGPLCLYQGRSYSEGAYVCVQKSLMLNCATEGPRAVWRVVADHDLSDRCVAPTARRYVGTPAHGRRMHAARHLPVRAVSARCFNFQGKQYCE
jgi:hypothetical protein